MKDLVRPKFIAMSSVAVYLFFVAQLTTGANQYSGPKCLGPFCIDPNVPMAHLFVQLGWPATSAPEFSPYCFQSKDGRTFLYIEPIHEDRETAADVFLSDFPNCFQLPKHTADILPSWKTREGIGLGSSEADVRRAYGKPSSEGKINDLTVRVRIKGDPQGDNLPTLGDRKLFYSGDVTNDLSAAEFGIRDGKVSYIWLSYNE